MDTITPQQLLTLLKPILIAILNQLNPTSVVGRYLLQLAISLLGQVQAHVAQHSGTHAFAAVPPLKLAETLPPAADWTVEGLTAHAERQLSLTRMRTADEG